MPILAGILVLLASLAGVLLTLLTLPGLWLTLLVALACWWWIGYDFYSPWTVGVALGLGVLAEVIDVVASGAGAAKAGGGRSGAIGSIIGAFVGAIAGSFVVPILGTIAGGVIGAGVGAIAGEKGIAARSWKDSARVARGAMVGRFIALCVKIVLATAIGALLTVAAFIS